MSALIQSRSQLAAFLSTTPPKALFYHLFQAMKEEKAMINQEAQNRFFNMLNAAPELKQYWDMEEGAAKIKSIQIALDRKAKEDAMLLRFLGSVWFGNSDMFDFDFIHAIKHMSKRDIKIVRKWLVDPFFC
ncbi:hypothetical protein [Marinomonas posidonica]|uniref:hypothetical protein n=1 Tax=Marinomonas posidonica TaxID=936476 RepID=UPI003736DCDC